MSHLPRTTIEQWAVLRAVIDEGGYAQAAEALNRSQSSVSYAIGRLKEALGVDLLEIQGRRAVLTERGAALLAEASSLIEDLQRLEARAQSMADGQPARVRILVDSLFPKSRLFDAMDRFAKTFPHIDIHLQETVRKMIGEANPDDYDVAVLVAPGTTPWTAPLAAMSMVCVARADHPLADSPRPLERSQLGRHVRVDIRGIELATATWGEDGAHVWLMNSVDAGIEAVRRGVGFGWLPEHMIGDDLQSGRLVRLPLKVGGVRNIPLGLHVNETRRQTIPAIEILMNLLQGKDPDAAS